MWSDIQHYAERGAQLPGVCSCADTGSRCVQLNQQRFTVTLGFYPGFLPQLTRRAWRSQLSLGRVETGLFKDVEGVPCPESGPAQSIITQRQRTLLPSPPQQPTLLYDQFQIVGCQGELLKQMLEFFQTRSANQ